MAGVPGLMPTFEPKEPGIVQRAAEKSGHSYSHQRTDHKNHLITYYYLPRLK